MTGKNESDKQKDIDDVLSSIDSLLDTATDVEAEDLPVLNLEDEPVADKSKATELTTAAVTTKTTKKQVKKTSAPASKNINNKAGSKRPSKKTTSIDPKSAKQKSTKSTQSTKPVSNSTKPKIENNTREQANPATEEDQQKPQTSLDINSGFAQKQKELPVLDEIVTEEEMALIATGKELPKRVITEKFTPKTTTDKIIDTLAIQLADYNITRLEYEYLHELIDEILKDQKPKPKRY